MANKKTVTVYIGRFQPLHLGHTELIQRALASSDLVIILVGSAFQARTIKNPFTYEERKDMLERWMRSEAYFPEDVSILPLVDQPYNNAKWIQSVQETVTDVLVSKGWSDDNVDIHLIGSDRDESTWYLKAFPQWRLLLETPVQLKGDLSATYLRARMFVDARRLEASAWPDVPTSVLDHLNSFYRSTEWQQLKDEYDFIKKYKSAWAVAPYAPTFVTADCVVIQSGHILVVERGQLPGRGLWALPGGFVKPRQRLLDAAITELMEETGIKVPEKVLRASVVTKESFDDPDRSLRGRTITTAYLIRLDDTKPLPKVKGMNMPLEDSGGKVIVETKRAWWMPISEARANPQQWFEDHHAIIDWGVGVIKD